MSYIEREKAIRETIDSIVEILNIHNSVPLTKIACKMRELPTADVVPVVRCKGCNKYNVACCPPNLGWCEELERIVSHDHYCGYGERRCEE